MGVTYDQDLGRRGIRQGLTKYGAKIRRTFSFAVVQEGVDERVPVRGDQPLLDEIGPLQDDWLVGDVAVIRSAGPRCQLGDQRLESLPRRARS